MAGDTRTPRRNFRLSTYGPNTSSRLALVSLDDECPFRAYWPLRLTQILGGKRWSLSVVTYRTPAPVLTEDAKTTLEGRLSAPDDTLATEMVNIKVQLQYIQRVRSMLPSAAALRMLDDDEADLNAQLAALTAQAGNG